MLYKEAASIIQNVSEKKGSVKNLVLSSKFKGKKQLNALVCETLKYAEIIGGIIKDTNLLKREKVLRDDALCKVVLYDFLFGKGLKGKSTYSDAICRHKAALRSSLAVLKVKNNAVSNSDLLPSKVTNQVALPRYVRVNLLKTTVADAIEHFRRDGFTELPVQGLGYERFMDVIRGLKPKEFVRDAAVSALLVFAPTTDLHDHVLYRNGDVILQDKASCIPAFVLAPPPGSQVIDCCAAPGNKTTHAVAMMNNKGIVFAFDKDLKRVGLLSTQMTKAGVLCAKAIHKDFLQTDPTVCRFSDVQYAIVDPSCSGSGIVSRMNEVTDDKYSADTARLDSLSRFQAKILKHALSFPKVKKVVYSTCSVHVQENEAVVRDALHAATDFKLVPVLPALQDSRGTLEGWSEASKCLRLSPEKDLTNGFFVACFERRNPGDAREVVETKVVGAETDGERLNNEKKDNSDKSLYQRKTVTTSSDKRNVGVDVESVTLQSQANEERPGKQKKNRKRKQVRKEPKVMKDHQDASAPSGAKKQRNEIGSSVCREGAAASITQTTGKATQKKKRKKQRKHKPVTA